MRFDATLFISLLVILMAYGKDLPVENTDVPEDRVVIAGTVVTMALLAQIIGITAGSLTISKTLYSNLVNAHCWPKNIDNLKFYGMYFTEKYIWALKKGTVV